MFIKSLARFYGRACALRRIRLLCFFFEARIARIQTNWLKEDTNFHVAGEFPRGLFRMETGGLCDTTASNRFKLPSSAEICVSQCRFMQSMSRYLD